MFYDGSECNFLVAAFADVEPPLDAEVSQLSENDYLEIGRDILKLREEDFHYFLPRILCLLLVRSDRQILEDVFLALAVQELKDPHFLEIMRQYRSVEAEKKYIARWKKLEDEKKRRFAGYDLAKARAIAAWISKIEERSKPLRSTSVKIARAYWQYRIEQLANGNAETKPYPGEGESGR